MTSMESGTGASDLFQGLAFRQIVEMLESQDVATSLGAVDTADLERRFPELADVGVRDVTIDGRHGDVAGRVYHGSNAGGAGLVWVHGGAFVGGDLDMPEAHWVSLAIAARGFPVLSLDYRKALRGVHYPVPSDEVLAGWLWATTHADELGVAADNLHLGGASAGGNLVAGVTKRLRDGAGPLPSSLVLLYPVVHGELPPLPAELRGKLAADEAAVASSAAMFREMTFQYAGSETVLGDPYAFAANGDVSNQPPVLILNSESDFLRASGEAYAEDLRLAGVDVTVETEPGTRHGHVNGPDEPGALRSIDRLTTWLRRALLHYGGAAPLGPW
jgi:acetyl esterase